MYHILRSRYNHTIQVLPLLSKAKMRVQHARISLEDCLVLLLLSTARLKAQHAGVYLVVRAQNQGADCWCLRGCDAVFFAGVICVQLFGLLLQAVALLLLYQMKQQLQLMVHIAASRGVPPFSCPVQLLSMLFVLECGRHHGFVEGPQHGATSVVLDSVCCYIK